MRSKYSKWKSCFIPGRKKRNIDYDAIESLLINLGFKKKEAKERIKSVMGGDFLSESDIINYLLKLRE